MSPLLATAHEVGLKSSALAIADSSTQTSGMRDSESRVVVIGLVCQL